jgi:hypothetical protein
METGICKLCLEEKPLVDSHIIPNFLYKLLKQSDGSFLYITPNANDKELRKQAGISEPLLCAHCDNIKIQKYEDHLKRVLFNKSFWKNTSKQGVFRLEGFDYQKLKNALISILWRMSLSENIFFEKVRLGPKHEEVIRYRLVNDATFEVDEYPITLTIPLFQESPRLEITMQPDTGRAGLNRLYLCVLNGFAISIEVGSAAPQKSDTVAFLTKTHWLILTTPLENLPYLKKAYMAISQAINIRESRNC